MREGRAAETAAPHAVGTAFHRRPVASNEIESGGGFVNAPVGTSKR